MYDAQLNDGTLLLRLTLPGQPATKKTSQRILGRRILPSKQYLAYEQHCEPYCKQAWEGKLPIDFGVSVLMRLWLKSWQVGDETNYMQAVGDILQKWGVIANDAWLHWVDNGEHWFGGVDKENPRVEIELRRFRHPKEEYRAKKMNKG